MNLKKWLKKHGQSDTEFQQIALPPSPPVEEPDISVAPKDLSPVVQPSAIPEQIIEIESKLAHWAKGDRYYLQLKGVKGTDLVNYLKENGYVFKFGNFSKEVNIENYQDVEAEFNNMEQTFSVSIKREAINQIQEVFASRGAVTINSIEEIRDVENPKDQVILAGNFVKEQLYNLANMVDEASKQKFVEKFLELGEKFHRYSFLNSMLIALQQRKGMDGQVASKDLWKTKLGRTVKPEAIAKNEGLDVFVPILGRRKNDFFIKILNEYGSSSSGLDINHLNNYLRQPKYRKYTGRLLKMVSSGKFKTVGDLMRNLQEGSFSGRPVGFKMGPVYDLTQTDPIPGQEDKDPVRIRAEVDDKWRSVNNTPTEITTSLIDLAVRAAKSGLMNKDKKDVTEGTSVIEIKRQVDTGHAGGWSKGKEIAISEGSYGEREFSTIIHELAHSISHFGIDRPGLKHREKETDAEATAYVVLKHYGFEEPTFAANYIAMKRGDKKSVIERFESVLSAASRIVGGIEKQKEKDMLPEKSASGNWYKKIFATEDIQFDDSKLEDFLL